MAMPDRAKSVLDNPVVLLALCGAVSGVLNANLMLFDIEVTKNLFGAFFGFCVAAALIYLKLANLKQSAIVFVAFSVSWVVAFQSAIKWSDNFEELYQVGFPAGALGAGIVALGFALVFPAARKPSVILRTIAIGAIAGLLLGLDSPYFLFVIWQTLVAVSLGASVSKPIG
jgi:hypothetical protein